MSLLSEVKKTVVSAKQYENIFPNNLLNWPNYNQVGESITLPNSSGYDQWQASVALSSAGLTMAVVYYNQDVSSLSLAIYTRANKDTEFSLLQLITPTDQVYAGGDSSVAMSASGDVIVVGSASDGEGTGAFWIFAYNGGTYIDPFGKIWGPYGNVGQSVAINSTGTIIAVGAPEQANGYVSLWSFNPATLGLSFVLEVTVPFEGYSGQGYSVALSANGSVLVVGAPYENNYTGAVYVYTATAGEFLYTLKGRYSATGLNTYAYFGTSVATTGLGDQFVVGAPENDVFGYEFGGVFVFYYNPEITNYVQGQMILPADYDYMYDYSNGVYAGSNVSISSDGQTIGFGGPNDGYGMGAGWIFNRTSVKGWTENGFKKAGTYQNDTCLYDQGVKSALSADGSTFVLLSYNDCNSGETTATVFQ